MGPKSKYLIELFHITLKKQAKGNILLHIVCTLFWLQCGHMWNFLFTLSCHWFSEFQILEHFSSGKPNLLLVTLKPFLKVYTHIPNIFSFNIHQPSYLQVIIMSYLCRHSSPLWKNLIFDFLHVFPHSSQPSKVHC